MEEQLGSGNLINRRYDNMYYAYWSDPANDERPRSMT